MEKIKREFCDRVILSIVILSFAVFEGSVSDRQRDRRTQTIGQTILDKNHKIAHSTNHNPFLHAFCHAFCHPLGFDQLGNMSAIWWASLRIQILKKRDIMKE